MLSNSAMRSRAPAMSFSPIDEAVVALAILSQSPLARMTSTFSAGFRVVKEENGRKRRPCQKRGGGRSEYLSPGLSRSFRGRASRAWRSGSRSSPRPRRPKTASHMFAMPSAASTRMSTFTPSANTMFCHTMRMVLRAMRMARAMFEGLSSMSTTSAASIAASDPIAPMAIPISARMSTGASLMPSPTKASLASGASVASRCSTALTLSSGRSWACTSSRASFLPTASATSRRSPVSMMQRRTPASCRSRMVCAASSFTTSAITMCPT